MTKANGEYTVEGYGEKIEGYDGPYLDGHDFDPEFVFAYAGDPEKQAQYQNDLVELAEAAKADEEIPEGETYDTLPEGNVDPSVEPDITFTKID